MTKRTIKFICVAVTWFDKANGNTYHSVRITRCSDGATLHGKFQYGYGDHYRQTALEEVCRAKWLPPKYRGQHENGSPMNYSYEMDNGYPIEWAVSEGLKRECIANGQP